MALVEGQPIGNYRILSRIGSGGMGAVYLAEHAAIGKKVAIKVIHRDLSTSREVIGRFYQEAKAVNTIGNEHIVEVHDYGQSAEGDHFFVMELIDGRTLAQVLERERVLELGRAMHIAAQIADGLGAAHAAGIIHRDLKPDNVMLCKKGGDPDFVKLLDFGLAKVLAEGGVKNLTQAGVILGTPQYMSPEACESRKIDHRTDIYALGVLLFQMCTGQVPFDGDSMGAVLIKQVTQAPPAPRALQTTIPPALEQVILRCLAKSPAARFQTMQELIDALVDPQRYLASSPPLLPAATPGKAMPTIAAMVAPPPSAAPRVSAAQGSVPPPGPLGGMAPHGPPAPGSGPAIVPPPVGGMDAFGNAVTASVPMNAPGIAQSQPVPVRRTAAVAVPQNQTMMIATPPGFKKHPPRSRTPWLVAGVAIAVVTVAVVLAIVLSGSGSKSAAGTGAGTATGSGTATGTATGSGAATGSGTATGSGAATGSGTAAGSGTTGSGTTGSGTGSGSTSGSAPGSATDASPEPGAGSSGPGPVATLARIQLTSDPTGAEVFDATGKKLGVTPTEIGLPADGKEHELTFRHPSRKERKKTIVASGDMTVTVVLSK